MTDPLSFRIKKKIDRYIHDPIVALIILPFFLILESPVDLINPITKSKSFNVSTIIYKSVSFLLINKVLSLVSTTSMQTITSLLLK